jgi:tetratricopeptide (TPR) repeat protein
MRLKKLIIALWVALLCGPVAKQANAQQSELAAGRESYRSDELKAAVFHFQQVLKGDPNNAAANYWLGRSYETLADISAPLGIRYHSLARRYLTRASELAPRQVEYRHELFEFFLDANQQQQARRILLTLAESDPDYDYMLSRLEQARRVNSSVYARIGHLLP